MIQGLRRRLQLVHPRLVRGLLGALADPGRPILVSLIVTRRCNLSCAYCHEYDATSPPVPLADLTSRIDALARLQTVIVTLTGGEPLLHPDLPQIVRHVRERGMVPAINTNGFLLTRDRVVELGRAGLCSMQVSIDGSRPHPSTNKSLKTLLPKLRLLAEHATFHVRVNTVLGAAPPDEAIEVAQTALSYGFGAKVALLRTPQGTLQSTADPEVARAHRRISRLAGRWLGLLGESFQDQLLAGDRVAWRCRAGARYFHVCEDGLVHLCPPRWKTLAAPLSSWGAEQIARAFREEKACSTDCAIAYAHQISRLDQLRA